MYKLRTAMLMAALTVLMVLIGQAMAAQGDVRVLHLRPAHELLQLLVLR